ncbi:MAG: hypothetical protein P1V33_02955 [Pseudohongiella nitratireducens]|nr:hypothetical protein [Pseudohongiella nitratireducens]MDF1622415.1 hypothetical protein [Pseudohongiella nitratireducens]
MSISAEFISQCRVLGMHSKASVFSVVLFLAAIALPAQAQNELQTSTNPPDSFSVSGSERFLQTADTGKFALIITGAAASPEIRQRFRGWTSQLDEILQRDYDYSADHVRILLDDGDNVGGLGARVAGASTADAIEEHLRDWQSDMTAGDLLSVFMIGHGAATFGDAKFNNVGPDMTGDELALWLEPYQEQDIVLFNMTNAGFEFARALSAPGRIVISATRSSAERFDPIFPRYLLAGLEGRQADLDRNEQVSILELFNFASSQVAAWYDEQGRLPTEHAVLDDTGDGLFSLNPGIEESDGLLAEVAYLNILTPDPDKQSPQAPAMLAEVQALERQVILLRNQKANYLEAEYWRQMEDLLIALARTTEAYHDLP